MTEQPTTSTPQKSPKGPHFTIGIIVLAAIVAVGAWLMGRNSNEENLTDREQPTQPEDATQLAGTPPVNDTPDADINTSDQPPVAPDTDETPPVTPPDDEVPTAPDESVEPTSEFVNGTYEASGQYSSPAGNEEVNISITLQDDIITAATFEGLATHPVSQNLQVKFAEGFEQEVIGKNIEDVQLTVVNGSSLTPIGFMQALDQIEEEARS